MVDIQTWRGWERAQNQEGCQKPGSGFVSTMDMDAGALYAVRDRICSENKDCACEREIKKRDTVVLLLVWEKRFLHFLPCHLCPLSPLLSLQWEEGKARWVAVLPGMQQWGRWSFIFQWKVYFSLVNRQEKLPLPNSILFLTFLSASYLLPFSFLVSYVKLYRTDWGYYFFFPLSFSFHAVILEVPLCSCFQDKFKNIFSTAALKVTPPYTPCFCPSILHIDLHTHPLSQASHTQPVSSFLPVAVLLSWTLTSDSLPPAVHSSGRDLHLICISWQIK